MKIKNLDVLWKNVLQKKAKLKEIIEKLYIELEEAKKEIAKLIKIIKELKEKN